MKARAAGNLITMAAINKDAASRAKARVLLGKDAKGNQLSYDELKHDIQKLREYAQSLPDARGAKLNQQIDKRVQELDPKEAEPASEVTTEAPSESATEATKAPTEATKAPTDRQSRDSQLEHCKKMVKGKLLTPNTYSKVRKEFLDQKRAPTNKNGKVYEGSELTDAELQDHACRLFIYASTMKHACRRAQLEKEVMDKMQDDNFNSMLHGAQGSQ